eukprot:gene23398-48403_t
MTCSEHTAQETLLHGVQKCNDRTSLPPCRLSLVGHSFGGVVVREAARPRVCLREAAFFRAGGVEPAALITLASPHRGQGSLPGEDLSLSSDALLRLALDRDRRL